MARIEFLTGSEIESFESVPEFKNSFERDYFFKLPKNIYDRALTLGNDELFCIFTLMYGYFKVSNKFFDFTYKFSSTTIIFCHCSKVVRR